MMMWHHSIGPAESARTTAAMVSLWALVITAIVVAVQYLTATNRTKRRDASWASCVIS
jgi:hypothetical protein